MDVFISWAGARSHAVAEALKTWLPMVINAVRPWLSSADIDSGARWATEVAATLERAKIGIICLTPKSLTSEWVLFEAGALSKTIAGTYVCPLLIDLAPSDLTGPLAQFQARLADKAGIRRLVDTINAALGEFALAESQLNSVFEVLWPVLASKLASLPSDDVEVRPGRNVRDLVEEVLDIVRNLSNKPLSGEGAKAITSAKLRSVSDLVLANVAKFAKRKVESLQIRTDNADSGLMSYNVVAHFDGKTANFVLQESEALGDQVRKHLAVLSVETDSTLHLLVDNEPGIL